MKHLAGSNQQSAISREITLVAINARIAPESYSGSHGRLIAFMMAGVEQCSFL
jgi:hypothetical protein